MLPLLAALPCFAGISPAFGYEWKWCVLASAAGWPEVHVTLNGKDYDGTLIIWRGALAATDSKHTLDALVNQTMKEHAATLSGKEPSTTRISAPGFFGWGVGVHGPGVEGAGAVGRALFNSYYYIAPTLVSFLRRETRCGQCAGAAGR
jgi:hypothetical protein